MQARCCCSSATCASSSGLKLTPVHQHAVSKLPLAEAAHSLAWPHSGHSGACSGAFRAVFGVVGDTVLAALVGAQGASLGAVHRPRLNPTVAELGQAAKAPAAQQRTAWCAHRTPGVAIFLTFASKKGIKYSFLDLKIKCKPCQNSVLPWPHAASCWA